MRYEMNEAKMCILILALLLFIVPFSRILLPMDPISDFFGWISNQFISGVAEAFNTVMAPFVLAFQILIAVVFLVMMGNNFARAVYIAILVGILLNLPYLSYPGEWLSNNIKFLGIPVLSATTWNVIIYGLACIILFGGGRREKVKVVIVNKPAGYRYG